MHEPIGSGHKFHAEKSCLSLFIEMSESVIIASHIPALSFICSNIDIYIAGLKFK